MSNALSIPVMATRCLSFCLAALLAPLCTIAIYPAHAHETVLVKNHPVRCQKGNDTTALPTKRPPQTIKVQKFRGSLKDPLYNMDNGKVWSCAFFSCDGGKRKQHRPAPALPQQETRANALTHQRPVATASPRTEDRLDTHRRKKANTTRVAVLRIDAELKRLILALLKQKQPQQNGEDSHCQDMVRGIAFKVHNSPSREQLAGRTRNLALDMQYYCRKQHFIKAYSSYKKLIAIIDGQ